MSSPRPPHHVDLRRGRRRVAPRARCRQAFGIARLGARPHRRSLAPKRGSMWASSPSGSVVRGSGAQTTSPFAGGLGSPRGGRYGLSCAGSLLLCTLALLVSAGDGGARSRTRPARAQRRDQHGRRRRADGADGRGLPPGRPPYLERVRRRGLESRRQRPGRRSRRTVTCASSTRASSSPRGCARPRGRSGSPRLRRARSAPVARHRDGRAHARPAHQPSARPGAARASGLAAGDPRRGRVLRSRACSRSGPRASTPCARRRRPSPSRR